MGPSGPLLVTSREPSGEMSHSGTPYPVGNGSMSYRASSRPRPLIGSRDETISCLRSTLASTTTQVSDGGLEQKNPPKAETERINSGDPPLMGIRTIGLGVDGPPGIGKTRA